MRSKALVDLRESYSHLLAARTLAEHSQDEDAQAALRLSEDDFLAVAEELARMVPHIVPRHHLKAFAPEFIES